jgi:exosortase
MNQKIEAEPPIGQCGEDLAMNATDITFERRLLLFGGWLLLSSLLFAKPLIALLRLSYLSGELSYVMLIPFIGAWVLFVDRRRIFLNLSLDPTLGAGFLSCAVCIGLVANFAGSRSANFRLSIFILALVMAWVSGFLLLFGKGASRAASFPLLFLLLMIPLPQPLFDQAIYLLRTGSAWITGLFFDLFGVPALREGFVFHLPGVNIEVSQECSGIRSSMVLLILALIVAHFYLVTFWKKTLFVIFGLFIMILKNGIRIATLTLLAMYVNPGFLTGRLHHQGGVVFFLVSLLFLLPLLRLLQRGEFRESGVERTSQTLVGTIGASGRGCEW